MFDRTLFRRHRDISVIAPESDYYDYLRTEAAARLVDRLDDITRKFPTALDLGCHRGHIFRQMCEQEGIGGVELLVQSDISLNAIEEAKAMTEKRMKESEGQSSALQTKFVVADEEELPFAENEFDLVVSSLSLHW